MSKHWPVFTLGIADAFLLVGFMQSLRSAGRHSGWVMLAYAVYVLARIAIFLIAKSDTEDSIQIRRSAEHSEAMASMNKKVVVEALDAFNQELKSLKEDVSKLKLGKFGRT